MTSKWGVDLKDESTFGLVLDQHVYLFIMIGSRNVTVFMRSRSLMNSSFCALHFIESWFTSSGIVSPENTLVSG